MPRKIKRLHSSSVSSPRSADPERCEKELEWWRGLGINTVMLQVALSGSAVGRRIYEDQLRARIDRFTVEEIRHARSALKRAAPLLGLLKTVRTDEGELCF